MLINPEAAGAEREPGERSWASAFARQARFDRPILHGLCTYGFTGRALLHRLCGRT